MDNTKVNLFFVVFVFCIFRILRTRGADSVKLPRSTKNSAKAAALLLKSWAIDHMKVIPLPKVSSLYLSIDYSEQTAHS